MNAFVGAAQGLAQGLGIRKERDEREKAAMRQDRMMGMQLEIAKTNAAAAREMSAARMAQPMGMPAQPDTMGMPAQPDTMGMPAQPDTMAYPQVAGADGPSAHQPSGGATFASLLARHEGAGDPDTLFGHSQKSGPFKGTRVSQMTIAQALDFANPKGAYGQWVKRQHGVVATPMGFGQIVGSTLRGAVAEMGLDPNTRFDAATQSKIVDHLAARRIAAGRTMADKRAQLRAEWVGYRNVPDADLDAAIQHFEARRGGVPARAMSTRAI